ncbi:hypothetical protein EC973_004893 [Apophysomyces ossiformis]|uniref:Uncharacterized protein n=1 Tax=Apophysomyces ossiformis TaxID=679940 RepID=A0A8H7BS04_9FUNG|nr:hypothetical protein EC973_004893 [Apophysomyces ossiformis]
MQGRIRLQKDESIAPSQWMDKQRNNLLAYEYLCHIGEAKEWIENCLQEELEPIIQLEESMRNGIILAKLAKYFAPGVVRKIFYDTKLQFRHSDNINYFFRALQTVRLPQIFWFELTDLYDKKNIPKVIYCIHALSHLLARRNMAPNIKDLLGQLEFTKEELNATQRTLDLSGVTMPNFRAIGSSLRKEMSEEFSNEFLRSPTAMLLTTPELIIEEEEDEDEEEEEEEEEADSEGSGSPAETELSDRGFLTDSEPEGRSTAFDSYWADPKNREKLAICQAIARTWLARRQHHEDQEKHSSDIFFRQLELIQANIRGSLSRQRLQPTDRSPTPSLVRMFVHLLDDSEFDLECEQVLEDLHQKVIRYIRENNELDIHVNALDIQIALLLKNAITIEEVIKRSGAFKTKKDQQRRMTELAHANVNPFDLNGFDKSSRYRRELYEQMIYLLQTEPKYLARLLSLSNQHAMDHKFIESVVLTLFGFATNDREEYLLLNLCKHCIVEEMKYVNDTQDFMKGNFAFLKLVVHTNRGAKEREFFRKLLRPLVYQVVSNDVLDLDTDPMSIYHKTINEEESRLGRPSTREHAITVPGALSHKDVRETFIEHLQDLRDITKNFLHSIINSTDHMPYGIRVIARELRDVLEMAFPEEPEENIAKIIGHFIYYRYLNPAIVAPEQYDVIDAIINPMQRKNLAEISKLLHHISSCKTFDEDDIFLQPLNEFICNEAWQQFSEWFMELTNVEEPESYFGMHAWADQVNTHKPTVYITPSELFQLHSILSYNLEDIEPEGGLLCDILNELGPSPYNPDIDFPDTMLCLTLSNRCDNIPLDPNEKLRHILTETKRLTVYVLRIQSDESLADIFDTPSTEEHEAEWEALKKTEFKENKNKTKRRFLQLGQNEPPLDLQPIKFRQLKSIVHRLVEHLEKCKMISDWDEVVRLIARDITGKNARRLHRDREINRTRITLYYLKQKQQYLLDQRKQYEDYLTSCMTSMATKHGKKAKLVLPFSRQYFHLRGLRKHGLVPKFGSYKYTAKQLHERGILIELEDIPKKHYDRISMVISMDQVDVITIEGGYAGWSLSSVQVDIPYEQLLQTQYEGVQTMTVLDGVAKVNVNLLIYFINKK